MSELRWKGQVRVIERRRVPPENRFSNTVYVVQERDGEKWRQVTAFEEGAYKEAVDYADRLFRGVAPRIVETVVME